MITQKMIEAFQQRYRELAKAHNWGPSWLSQEATVELLQAVLAAGEPVAWMRRQANGVPVMTSIPRVVDIWRDQGCVVEPLFAAPQVVRVKALEWEEGAIGSWRSVTPLDIWRIRSALSTPEQGETEAGVTHLLAAGSAPDRLWLHPEHGMLSGPLDGSEVAYDRVDTDALAEREYRRGAEADFESHVQHLRQARDWE